MPGAARRLPAAAAKKAVTCGPHVALQLDCAAQGGLGAGSVGARLAGGRPGQGAPGAARRRPGSGGPREVAGPAVGELWGPRGSGAWWGRAAPGRRAGRRSRSPSCAGRRTRLRRGGASAVALLLEAAARAALEAQGRVALRSAPQGPKLAEGSGAEAAPGGALSGWARSRAPHVAGPAGPVEGLLPPSVHRPCEKEVEAVPCRRPLSRKVDEDLPLCRRPFWKAVEAAPWNRPFWRMARKGVPGYRHPCGMGVGVLCHRPFWKRVAAGAPWHCRPCGKGAEVVVPCHHPCAKEAEAVPCHRPCGTPEVAVPYHCHCPCVQGRAPMHSGRHHVRDCPPDTCAHPKVCVRAFPDRQR